MLGISPNTERKYRNIFESAGLLDGEPDDLPALKVLKEAIAKRLGAPTQRRQNSSIDGWREAVEKMLNKGEGHRPRHLRLH